MTRGQENTDAAASFAPGSAEVHEWRSTGRPPGPGAAVTFRPILDVAQGVAAGYQAVGPLHDVRSSGPLVDSLVRADAVRTVEAALAASSTLPVNTFIAIPVPLELVGDDRLRSVLRSHGDLGGVVLDITDFSAAALADADGALGAFREAGALIAVGGRDASQPELGSIIRLRPSIIRLGRAWVGGLDESAAKRSAIEITGRLAAQLDAWILAEAVSTAAELRALAELGVPLAQGPLIGEPHRVWPEVEIAAAALPLAAPPPDGVLRGLMRKAYTTHDAVAARKVLPDTSGFELVVVVDDRSRPVALLQQEAGGRWNSSIVLTVNVDTPVGEAVTRAMARPRPDRFSPMACTDAAGRFLGILRIDELVSHLAGTSG